MNILSYSPEHTDEEVSVTDNLVSSGIKLVILIGHDTAAQPIGRLGVISYLTTDYNKILVTNGN